MVKSMVSDLTSEVLTNKPSITSDQTFNVDIVIVNKALWRKRGSEGTQFEQEQ